MTDRLTILLNWVYDFDEHAGVIYFTAAPWDTKNINTDHPDKLGIAIATISDMVKREIEQIECEPAMRKS